MSPPTDLPAPPSRPEDGHKGTFGSVLVVAGSRGMSGAACLAALGALRGGAGLVRVAVPAGIQEIVASHEPSYLTYGLPEDSHGRLSGRARGDLEELIEKSTVVAFGPGCGQSPGLKEVAESLYSSATCPVVIDADGLNMLASDPETGSRSKLAKPAGPRVMTPHPGEFARLTGLSTGEVLKNREENARTFATENGVVLLLKGAGTIITDGTKFAKNETGNSGMGTGGMGDVLTGLIAALLAQGMEPFEAAYLGAYLHGLAGDLAADDLSQPGLIASDLPRYLCFAWSQLLSRKPPGSMGFK